ncbi:MAG: exodeoxyribonuclease VII small subunit [Lacipirellulaceae bacterium]
MAKKKVVKKKKETGETLSFEDSLAELESIVGKLESGQLPLSDSLAAYEQGVKRVKGCYALLEDAERRIELVTSVDEQGVANTQAYDESEEGDLTKKAGQRARRRTARKSSDEDDASSLF